MLAIKVSTKALAKAKERLVNNANRRYRNIVYKWFDEILRVSPQYSGDFVSNWQIVVGSAGGVVEPAYREWPLKHELEIRQQPRAAGDPLAIGYARSQMVRRPFNYKDKVYFVNPTPLHFTETTVSGPDGRTQNLRPENLIGMDKLLGSYLKAKFGA